MEVPDLCVVGVAACAKQPGHYLVPKKGKQPAQCKKCIAPGSKQLNAIFGATCYRTIGNGNSCSAS